MMPRLGHGTAITLEELREARNALVGPTRDLRLGFAAVRPIDLQDFDFLFPDLQNDPANLLPVGPQTVNHLARLGRTMLVDPLVPSNGDANIPAAYTYLGQFVDHDITLETLSASLPALLDPNLTPLALNDIRATIRNLRNPTLDLDSVYGLPAPRDPARPAKMQVGLVTALGQNRKPFKRPPNKGDDNDLPREGRSSVDTHDRAALIGDPRNDENTIVAQLHVAFLKAHNALVDQGRNFRQAQRLLRQHYQHIVIHDFLKKRIADPQIVEGILQHGNRVYDALAEPFFLPLEYAVAAYRFGHSMVRGRYDFNLNFNTSGEDGTTPATLFPLLFTFTAISGQLGFGQGNDTLPENWIIEWENFVDTGVPFNKARLIDTKLVEPLAQLTNFQGVPELDDGARLAVRNLLRGYLLRLPTGQAVAGALGLAPLTPAEIEAVATAVEAPSGQESQVDVLREAGFLNRTPLWYYILAEAAARAGGQYLGPVGSTIVAEVLIGLVRRSSDSILRHRHWTPSLPSAQPGTFELSDLLRFAGVLPSRR
jgi:hypothetical protein